MRLVMDSAGRRVTLVTPEGNREVIFDRPYPTGDDEHTMLVRSLGDRGIMVSLKKKGTKKPVRSDVIRFLSGVRGNYISGEPRLHVYDLDIEPGKPAFPILELVERIEGLGVPGYNVTPIFDGLPIEDCVAAHSSPIMHSDGTVGRRRMPETRNMMEAVSFTVVNGSWSILSFGNHVSHVYLRMTATDKADDILTKIREIQSQPSL